MPRSQHTSRGRMYENTLNVTTQDKLSFYFFSLLSHRYKANFEHNKAVASEHEIANAKSW